MAGLEADNALCVAWIISALAPVFHPTIVTIERPSPDRLSAGPLYICALHALGFVTSRVFLRYRVDNRIQAYSIKNRPVLGLGWSFGEPQH